MSDLWKQAKLSDSTDGLQYSKKPVHQILAARKAFLGKGLAINRILPHRQRRMVGAWCFFYHFGPIDLKETVLNIAPHPHIGLQTFTWPLAGEILHRDSLGSEQIIRPGQINLMTAGKGIAHSEESLADNSLHGLQLWIALPEAQRFCSPEFAHYPDLPQYVRDGLFITVLAGDFGDQQAPTKVYTPLLGLDLEALQDASTILPLNPKFEYAVYLVAGQMDIEGELIEAGTFVYLGCGRHQLAIAAPCHSRILVLGGEPFKEEILIWWNFVARSRNEIVQATEDWEAGTRFGAVIGYQGKRLKAPIAPWIR